MYKTQSGKEITLSKKIAKGGEGEVFEIVGDSNNCIKIYYERVRSPEKEEKLKYMVLNPPEDLQGITHKICWPKEVIYEEGKFVGFLMPKAFDDSLLPYHLCQPLIPKKLSSQWHATFDRKTFKGITSRLKLSVNIVAIVNRIHTTNKYIIVDLKPQNLLVTAFGKVSIIDLDSVQITQNDLVLFKAPVSTPEYTPPEAREVIKSKSAISKDWDIFSLGILIYEILCGIHPYVGSAKAPHKNLNTIQEKIKVNLTHITKGESAFSTLPNLHQTFYNYNTDLKNIFKRIFSPYILKVSVRPRLEDFGETLFNAVALLEEEFKKEEQKRLEQEKIKKKREELEAIKNYKKLKKSNRQLKDDYTSAISKLAAHKSENTSLRKQVEETKNKSNVLVPVLVILLLLFMGLFIGNYTSNSKKSQENNLPLEQYETDISSNNYKSLILDNKSNVSIYVAIGYVDCDLEYHYINKKSTGWHYIESGKELSLDLISILGDEKYFRCGKLWLYAENNEQTLRWSGEDNNNHFILHNTEQFNYIEWVPPAKRSTSIRKEKFFEIQLDEGVTRKSFTN
jgi:hypothetical protein